MKTFVRLLLVLISFVGILDAGYLTYEKVNHIIPPCSTGFQCDTVLTSRFANIGPVPLSALGMIFYTIVFFFAVLNFLEQDHVRFGNVHFHTYDIQLVLSIFGALFSLYLVTLMGVVLQAWCLYCLISALLCAANFFFSTYQWKVQQGLCVKECSRPRAQFVHWAYAAIVKHIFFLLDPEAVHNLMVRFGAILGGTPLFAQLTRWMFAYEEPSLQKTIDGILFPNSVGLSAGFDYDGDLTATLPAVGFGFMTIGTVTNHPYQGNEPPRLGRFPKSKALLVNKGFKTMGAKALIRKLENKKFSIPVGISIGSTNMLFKSEDEQIKDIMTTFILFEKSKVRHSFYELNISCPNTKGGQPFTTVERLRKLLTALEKLKVKKPVYIKMPIDLGEKNTLPLLTTADKFTIAGVIFGNLTKDHDNPDVNPEDRVEWAKKKGNLSGKPTWNRSNALISMTKKHFKKRFTIIGTGGIFSGADAREKMKRGADLVQLITGMIFEGPQLIGQINHFLGKEIK